MAMYMACIGCQSGHHEYHRDVPVPGPEGGVGGQVCLCRGECAARSVTEACSTFDCNKPAVANGRCENCERIVAKFSAARAFRETDASKET